MKITTGGDDEPPETQEVGVDIDIPRDSLGLVITIFSPLDGVRFAKIEIRADELERIGRALAPWVRT